MTPSRLLASALILLVASFAVAQSKTSSSLEGDPGANAAVLGRWDVVITNASKIDVPFEIHVKGPMQGPLRATIVNGSEEMPFSNTEWDGAELKLTLEQYDGQLVLHPEGDGLTGKWSRQTRTGVMHYPVRATRHRPMSGKPTSWKGQSLAGEWIFEFEGTGASPDRIAPARFKQSGELKDGETSIATVEGTVAPVSGDYGLLGGTIIAVEGKQPTIRLSRFDGIHIVLLRGEFQPDGSIKGKLNTQAFTARRRAAQSAAGDSAAQPDAESITTLKDPAEEFRFTATDPKTGKQVTQEDPRFKGKPYIVDIFGTWCPNCHDEAPLLADLYRRYRAQGLEIVGLSYEYVDDPKRNARLLEIYRKKHGLEFPLLLAGTTDDGQIEKTLPQLVGFGAYPTTLFVGRDGKVKKIHAGFAGPATGEAFTETKKRFEENVQELVK